MLSSLPDRYRTPWPGEFDEAIRSVLVSGMTVLDVGAGRQPSVLPAERPAGVTYIGIDISENELAQAPSGAYDRRIVADVLEEICDLRGTIDLVVSFQVFEHVKPLEKALEHIYGYLTSGGVMVAQVSGAFSMFGVANRLLPRRASIWSMQKLLHRCPDTVFDAQYDRCWHNSLVGMLNGWTSVTIIPISKALATSGSRHIFRNSIAHTKTGLLQATT